MPDSSDAGETLVDRLDGGRIVAARYRLEKLLGRGGMGVVWLASDDILRRRVALKFVTEMLAHDRAAIEDLKHETTRCLDLTHPRIVRIYDFVQDGPLAGISMEYVDGDTLSELRAARPHRCFEAAELFPWLAQMAEALDYAHREAKVVHRDLKPSNVMLARDGQIKVSDFGIARSISDSLTRVSAQIGKVSGTLGYMSPQQAQGAPPQAADDIYAVGAMLFELLTGKPPFFGPPALVFQQLLNIPAPGVNERRQEFSGGALPPVPRAWEETIARCLAKDPVQRPRAVEEVRAALAPGGRPATVRALAAETPMHRAIPASGGPSSPAPPAGAPEVRTHGWLGWAGAAGFAVAGIALGTGIWWALRTDERTPSPASGASATPRAVPSPSPIQVQPAATPQLSVATPAAQPVARVPVPAPNLIPATPPAASPSAPSASAPSTPTPPAPEPPPSATTPVPSKTTPRAAVSTRDAVAPLRQATPRAAPLRQATPRAAPPRKATPQAASRSVGPPRRTQATPVARATPRPATPVANPGGVTQEERDRAERVRRAFQRTRPGGGL
jgi:serine/threonine protein kinase